MTLSPKELNDVIESVKVELEASYRGVKPVESEINSSESIITFSVGSSMKEGDFGSAVDYLDGMSVKLSPNLVVELSVQESKFASGEIVVSVSEYR